ncbi:hypothetical protein ACOZ38_10765 [Sphaerisporangium viridialbum]|uniref:hypothetical protein n=1 Tax=Sphaerisporangium viridialbum TaxID=46189 RepID=UPI003C73376A
MEALKALKEDQGETHELVFSTQSGSPVAAHNTRRDFRKYSTTQGSRGRSGLPKSYGMAL